MAGFNLARKSKKIQDNSHVKNLTALNQRATSDNGNNNPAQEGFDLIGTSGKTYDLEVIEASKDRASVIAPLIIENTENEIQDRPGALSISTDDSKKVIPTKDDYKKYLLD